MKGKEMNERIKEVWIKAASEDSDPDNWDTQEQFIERFAELIVRECADQFKLVHTDEQYQRRIDKTILKHFGLYE